MIKTEYFDAHAHAILDQIGGIIIGLEGAPKYDGVPDNAGAVAMCKDRELFFAAEYIRRGSAEQTGPIVKYHPRREQYSVNEVCADIRVRRPKLCIIDSLNLPFWQPQDYWDIAIKFKEVNFILAHSGGYDILHFIKMCGMSANIWLDFSLTQEYFGWCGTNQKLSLICDTIDYALENKKLSKKILFASDAPFYSQKNAAEKYQELKFKEDIFKNNFIELIKNTGL